jgi:hypothetical protein
VPHRAGSRALQVPLNAQPQPKPCPCRRARDDPRRVLQPLRLFGMVAAARWGTRGEGMEKTPITHRIIRTIGARHLGPLKGSTRGGSRHPALGISMGRGCEQCERPRLDASRGLAAAEASMPGRGFRCPTMDARGSRSPEEEGLTSAGDPSRVLPRADRRQPPVRRIESSAGDADSKHSEVAAPFRHDRALYCDAVDPDRQADAAAMNAPRYPRLARDRCRRWRRAGQCGMGWTWRLATPGRHLGTVSDVVRSTLSRA